MVLVGGVPAVSLHQVYLARWQLVWTLPIGKRPEAVEKRGARLCLYIKKDVVTPFIPVLRKVIDIYLWEKK
jgi:hypothetical protein